MHTFVRVGTTGTQLRPLTSSEKSGGFIQVASLELVRHSQGSYPIWVNGLPPTPQSLIRVIAQLLVANKAQDFSSHVPGFDPLELAD